MNDAFTTYESQSYSKKHKPVVPEPATYGMIFMALTLVLVGWRRFRSRR